LDNPLAFIYIFIKISLIKKICSGLARCPSVAAVTPIKINRTREYDGNRRNGFCNLKLMLLTIGLFCCLLIIGILYTKRIDGNENNGKPIIDEEKIKKVIIK
jgi:hypothetical protein